MTFTSLASSSAGNAYLVDDGRTKLLLECGVPYRRLQKLMGFDMAEVKGCLLSHEHGDHAKCVADILKNGVPVYASAGTAEALGSSLITVVDECDAAGRRALFCVGTFEIMPFATFHDAAEPYGFLIRSTADGERLMFATDTVNLGYRFPEANIIAIECNYDEAILARATKMPEKVRHRIQNSHMDIARVCAYLGRADLSSCRAIYLLHLSDACSNEGEFTQRVRAAVGRGIAVTVCPK